MVRAKQSREQNLSRDSEHTDESWKILRSSRFVGSQGATNPELPPGNER